MSILLIEKNWNALAVGGPWDETQPSSQKNNIYAQPGLGKSREKKRFVATKSGCLSCLAISIMVSLGVLVLGGIYFFFPFRTNLAILGIDYAPANDFVGRSDTLMLVTSKPFRPYVGVLSIPRDLWVTIPGIGENRINTAHFFGEAQMPGSGPQKVIETFQDNFGVSPRFYIRFRFEDFVKVIEAVGGVDIFLEKPMAGYEAGEHHLNGRKALAFARNRLGSDDFFRMDRNQIIIKSFINKIIQWENWWRFPGVIRAVWDSVDTNLPIWLWPRLVLNFAWVGPEGIDFHKITREMVTPYTTDQGANVLLPDWAQIIPLVNEVFSE